MFPTTKIIDNFVRADEDPLNVASYGDQWSAVSIDSSANLWKLASNRALLEFSGRVCGQYDTAVYGPDSEVYVNFGVFGSMQLWARAIPPGALLSSGYLLSLISSGSASYVRVDHGGQTVLGASVVVAASASQAGLSVVGTKLVGYLDGVAIDAGRSDATFKAAGVLAMQGLGGSTTLTAFGGGTVAPTAPSSVAILGLGRGWGG